MEKKKEDLDALKAELAWAMVRRLREEIGKAQHNVDACQMKIEACQNKVEEETARQKEKKLEKVTKLNSMFAVSFAPTLAPPFEIVLLYVALQDLLAS